MYIWLQIIIFCLYHQIVLFFIFSYLHLKGLSNYDDFVHYIESVVAHIGGATIRRRDILVSESHRRHLYHYHQF